MSGCQAYTRWSQRKRFEDTLHIDTFEGDTLLEHPSPRQRDAVLQVVIVNAEVIASVEIIPGAHLEYLVFIDFASWTGTSGEVFQASLKYPEVQISMVSAGESENVRTNFSG